MNIQAIMPWMWVGVLVLLVVIEAATKGLTTIWGAISALIMVFISRTHMDIKWQILIFLLITIVLLFTTRPFIKKKLKIKQTPTNADTMLGKEVVITEPVSRFHKGAAKSNNGVIWTVTSNEETDIPEGTICTVKSIQGNTLMLTKKEEEK